ncbi:hypothetical protein WBP07_10225 [Novosphingobium sp. BL-8A]|uniref:hypothetical protein n=1 Tax=Novosphingobium sp. BL-8A TaxID=3127639 RepID=UPI0037581A17
MNIFATASGRMAGILAVGVLALSAVPAAALGYGRGGSRDAAGQCSAAAERTANRYSYGGRARVTDIRSVDRKDYGYKVKGRIAVNAMGRSWHRGDPDYGQGWGRDYRGWNADMRGWDSGTFECKVDWRGRVYGIDFKGIRGL